MMVYTWEKDGEQYAHGIAKVMKAPRFIKLKTKVCSMACEVELHDTGEKRADGRPKFRNTLQTFTAFGNLAEYCRDLEKGDVFAFYGKVVVDDYWTQKNETGEVVYKIVLEYCCVQPSINVYSPEGNSGDSFYDLPDDEYFPGD